MREFSSRKFLIGLLRSFYVIIVTVAEIKKQKEPGQFRALNVLNCYLILWRSLIIISASKATIESLELSLTYIILSSVSFG